jgi:thioredoxin reductase (NADPH)
MTFQHAMSPVSRRTQTEESAVDEVRNLIIIGSGPSGYTAALYAARANLKPLVIEGVQSGGALMTTTEVENFPGFQKGIQGPELMDEMREQALRFGAEFVTADADRVDLSSRPFRVTVGSEEFTSKSLIVSTGAKARMLEVEGEQRLLGHGVSTCATCDGFFFRGTDIAVVGGGDSAMEEAHFLTRFANSVTVIHRREDLRASKIMQDRARANPKIVWKLNRVVDKVVGDGKVESLAVRSLVDGATEKIDVAAMFVAIGHDPNSALFRGQLDLDDAGYIRTIEGSTRTSVRGVFACGDVVDHVYRQAITAAGTGCMAAIDTERFLEADADSATHA